MTKSSTKKSTKQAPVKDTTPEVDKLGTRIGTNCAAINACLTAKPKPLAKLIEESKQKAALVSNHLRTLIGKGLVKRTDAGYAIAKN